MVGWHRELRQLICNHEIAETFLHRKFIPESESVIKKAKAYRHQTLRVFLFKVNYHFFVVITDLLFFSPNRLPCFINRQSIYRHNLKTVFKMPAVFNLFGLLDFKSETTGIHHCFPFEI